MLISCSDSASGHGGEHKELPLNSEINPFNISSERSRHNLRTLGR